MFCKHGCGQPALFTTKSGGLLCSPKAAQCAEIRRKNSERTTAVYTSGKRKSGSEQYVALPDTTKANMAWNRGKILTDRGFVENSTLQNEQVTKHIIANQLFEHACKSCGISEWLSKPIKLELDHINGVNTDNRLENLRFMCPNCHSQTPTFRGRNINNGKIKVSDEDMIAAIQQSKNVRQTLIKVGLTPKGANYARIRQIMDSNNITFKE